MREIQQMRSIACRLPRRLTRRPVRGYATNARDFDVVVAGGGVVGASTAYHLALTSPHLSVAVVERDPHGTFASAPRSAGGIRQQFSLQENIELSLYGLDLLRNADTLLRVAGQDAPDMQLKENGYLFLATEGGVETLRANHTTQELAGASTTLLTPAALSQRFPWLNLEGIALGCFGESGEGWFDPWALVTAFKAKAMEMGVTYIHGEVAGLDVHSETTSVALPDGAGCAPAGSLISPRLRIQKVHVRHASDGKTSAIGCGHVVNAAGAFAGGLVRMCGEEDVVAPLPVAARRRCIFHVSTPLGGAADGDAGGAGGGAGGSSRPPLVPPGSTTPLVVDPSGVYFRPEGGPGQFICGVSPPSHYADPDCEDASALETVDHELFDEVIWPALYERVTAFGALRVLSSWSGFYEYNTLDQNAIIGRHPHVPNLVLANGFSGHGLQQAPGVGRAVAELISTGRYQTVDVSCFGFERVLRDEPIFEKNIV